MQFSVEYIIKEEIRRNQIFNQEVCNGIKQHFGRQLCRPVHSLISWLLILAMIQGSLLMMVTAYAKMDSAINQTTPSASAIIFNKPTPVAMEKLIEPPVSQPAEPLKLLIAPGGPVEVSLEQWCQVNNLAQSDKCLDTLAGNKLRLKN